MRVNYSSFFMVPGNMEFWGHGKPRHGLSIFLIGVLGCRNK